MLYGLLKIALSDSEMKELSKMEVGKIVIQDEYKTTTICLPLNASDLISIARGWKLKKKIDECEIEIGKR